jgi:methyl-accepting chemotaxis protein
MVQKRRTILLEGFQTRFVATQVTWLAVCSALFVVVLTGPLVWQINTGSAPALDAMRAAALLQLHDRLWMPLLALFLGVTWTLVRLSHRIAGPLYRFRQIFPRVAEGDLSVRVRVRDTDYLRREAEEFDRMIAAVRGRVRRSQEATAAVRSALAEKAGKTVTLQAHEVAELVARAEEADAALAEFVTAPVSPDATARSCPSPSRWRWRSCFWARWLRSRCRPTPRRSTTPEPLSLRGHME